MPRKKKQQIKVNNVNSLEGLMQETYNDACSQINDAQRAINEVTNSTSVDDVEDATKVAKSKTEALKIKDSAIKIKLEVAKLQNDIIKHNGNVEEAVQATSQGQVTADDFKAIRDMLEEGNNDNETDE